MTRRCQDWALRRRGGGWGGQPMRTIRGQHSGVVRKELSEQGTRTAHPVECMREVWNLARFWRGARGEGSVVRARAATRQGQEVFFSLSNTYKFSKVCDGGRLTGLCGCRWGVRALCSLLLVKVRGCEDEAWSSTELTSTTAPAPAPAPHIR